MQRRLRLRHVDELSFAGTVAVCQRGKDGERVVTHAHEVGVRPERTHRLRAGHAGQLIKATHGARQVAEAGVFAPRTALPEQTAAHHDDVRVQPLRRFVAETHTIDYAGRKRFAVHIGPSDQIGQHFAPFRGAEIERQIQFVGVCAVEAGRAFRIGHPVDVRRHGAQHVEPVARFDVNDRGAVVREHARSTRPRHHPEQIQHFEAG